MNEKTNVDSAEEERRKVQAQRHAIAERSRRRTVKAPGKQRNGRKVLQAPTDPAAKTLEAQKKAELAYDPVLRSLVGAGSFIKYSVGGGQTIPIPESFDALAAQIKDVQGGNLAGAERTLVAQANTLDAIFNELARRAGNNMGGYLPAMGIYLRLALKAQSQCRATLETLAAIKNPPVVYAKQANVTTGPQQINNATAAPSRAREVETEQTQLSGRSHELLPDARASGHAGRVNPALETLGEVHRAEVRRG